MTNENMKYLHVRQALADLAHFIRTMKATIPGMANSKAILTGGSYSATMVTWFKKLYPDLATGCWASSAPLNAKANFFGKLLCGLLNWQYVSAGIANVRIRVHNTLWELKMQPSK